MNSTHDIDLSNMHDPISDLFPQPKSPEEWEQYMLSKEQIEFFKENGYLSGIKILDARQIEVLREELNKMINGNKYFYEFKSNESADPTKVLFHALGAWRIGAGFHDILWSPAFRMAAYQLLGGTYRHFHDQLFCKPAGHGGVVAWHQDYSYWTWTKPMKHLTCWIGLDDASEENGCLYYIPKSHNWGLLPITGLAGEMDAVCKILDDEQRKQFDARVPNVLKMGYASFHHPLMMHGSYENRSERQRRATVINIMGDGVQSNINHIDRKEDLKGFPIKEQDMVMDGQFFPILFDPDKELKGLKSKVVRCY
jgi:ectoine hydroxylase-related dioxygenase (phytanoyl-CoA dioxygenase family)